MKVVIHENNCTDLAEAIRKMKNHLQDNPGLQVIKRGIGVSAVESPPNVVDVMATSVVLVLGPPPYTPVNEGTDAQVRSAIMAAWFRGQESGFMPSNIYKHMSEQEKKIIWEIHLERKKKGQDAPTAHCGYHNLEPLPGP